MKLEVQSPEGVQFRLNLAGPMPRLFARLLDAIVINASMAVFGNVIGLFALFDEDKAMAAYIVLTFVVSFGYGIILEWIWKGQTLGKRILKIQVMDESGLPLEFSQIFLRNLIRVVDSLPGLYLVGGVAVFLSSKNQRLGDIAARTIVVRQESSLKVDLNSVTKGRYNSMRMLAGSCARLRQNSLPEEAGLALEALMRRNDIESDARVRLFKKLRDIFELKSPFPEEATLGLSDEQYIRNVVEILFEQKRSSSKAKL